MERYSKQTLFFLLSLLFTSKQKVLMISPTLDGCKRLHDDIKKYNVLILRE